MAAVGTLLADFHVHAERVPAGRGRADRELDRGELRHAGSAPGKIPPRELAAARRFSNSFLASGEELIQARIDAGLVRDCHGDLRAEHVVLGERVQIFDCVEFDPALREIDVGADLAFLVMDLVHAGRDDLARELVAAYRHAGGDPGDDSLLSFFATYRAWVRAKVAALRAGELEAGDARTEAIERRPRVRVHRAPLRVAGARPPAPGRVRRQRHREDSSRAPAGGRLGLAAPVLGRRAQAVARPGPGAPGAGARVHPLREREHLRRARPAGPRRAGRRNGAIVDATFRFRRDRDAFARGLGGARCGPLFFECRAPAAELARRAAERERDARRVSDAGPEQVELQPREFEPLAEVPEADRETLRTDRPVEVVADDVERALDSRLASPSPR